MMADAINKYPEPRTIVLLTGDGNNKNSRTSFPEVLLDALRRGWQIELWYVCTRVSACSMLNTRVWLLLLELLL